MRRTPLKRSGKGLKRAPIKRKPPRRGAMDPDFREAVLRRDGRKCQAHRAGFARSIPCGGRLHVHHIVLGTKVDTMENVVTLCDTHHRYAHDVDRRGAEEAGLIVRRGSPNRPDRKNLGTPRGVVR